MTAPAKRETTPGAPPIRDVYFGRGTVGVLSFIISPLALGLLFTSTALLQDVGATGTPLGSPGGQLGMLVSAILIALIAHSARWSTIGISTLTGWAGVFAAVVTFHTLRPPSYMNGLEALLMWSQLPILTFTILLAATLATMLVRTRKERDRMPGPPSSFEMTAYATIALLFGLATVFLVYAIAPETAEAIILRYPSMSQRPTLQHWIVIVVIVAVLFALTWLATRALFAVQLIGWLLLLIPGLFLVPLISTLTGMVATPQNQILLAVAYSMPVIGVIGLLIVTSTHSISLMHRLS
ncbi:MAG TPA: hypothetical protein GX000_03960 [Actinomyces sp.]|jgi:hypothetical protein|nr:hypothetical protein [Acidobacteriota bacterium]HHT40778.1 hypothetical protein [Actinomyces sp.]